MDLGLKRMRATKAGDGRSRASIPVRLLAGMLFFTGWMLVAQMGYVAWAQGAQSLRLKDVLMAPGVAWLTHFAFHVAFRGREPTEEYWPFASSTVTVCYWVFVICFSVYVA